MSDFETYYRSSFQGDLLRFFDTIPDESKFHHDRGNKQVFSIQFDRLTPKLGHLNFLSKEEKEWFGISLFLAVLTDMVCYTHFRDNYRKFEIFTKHPKFIGNCLTACRSHLHPAKIFDAMNQGLLGSEEQLDFSAKFLDAVKSMELEVVSLVKSHLIEISAESFWAACEREFPVLNRRGIGGIS